MKYRIIEKLTGVKKTTPIAEIETSIIKDFCYVEELGILFVYDQCVGLIPTVGDPIIPWRGEEGANRQKFYEDHFDDPCSLVYSSHTRQLFVLEKGGSRIRILENLAAGTDLIKCEDARVMDVFFSKVTPNGNARIALFNKTQPLWISQDINRCFVYSDSMVSVMVGDGRGRYATATSLKNCSLNNPSDVVSLNNDILIADRDNFCVRRINGQGISLFCGNPTKPDLEPRRIALQDNIVYVLSGNSIKSFPLKNGNGNNLAIYESENIVDLTSGKNGLLILESIK